MLAASGGWFAEYGEVKLFETASAKERIRFYERKEWVECVKFSPDGRILASAGGFTAGTPGEIEFRRLSETAGRQPDRKAKMSAEQIQSLWEELGDADATIAYQAVQSLADYPDQALTVFKIRLRPAVAPDAERLTKLIAKLNDAKFQERERASKELEELGDSAAPALRKALAAGQPAEAQRRTTLLVRRLEIPVTARELLRIIRAVEVLEKIGTNEARELLQSLGKGAPEARLTSEAQDSLKRWK